MTNDKNDTAIIASVLSDAPVALLIAELERRGWGRGWVNAGAETFDMLYRERDEGVVPFVFEPDWGDLDEEKALSA